jgi:uncharacterized membrane protein
VKLLSIVLRSILKVLLHVFIVLLVTVRVSEEVEKTIFGGIWWKIGSCKCCETVMKCVEKYC